MQFRVFRLRMRRRLRKSQRQVEGLSAQAEQNIEQHFLRRFDRLVAVRRFVLAWLLLMTLLVGGVVAQQVALGNYYQVLKPVPGGIFSEGIVGSFSNANPIYATSDADTSVSNLIFAGLFKYNDHNQIVGDLASGYDIDAKGTTYTVHLKPNLKWQDGKPLTSSDVAFTYHVIQNPDAKSPLQASWQGVNVKATDPRTVVFELSNPLAPFIYNLTNGIVPEHLLASVPTADLRSADFNTVKPIGAGPFSWHGVQVSGSDPAKLQQQVALVPFADYRGEKAKLNEFIIHTYAAKADLVSAFKHGQLTAAEGLTSVPPEIAKMKSLQTHNLLLSAATMVFFKTTSGVLSDKQVRQALVQGADVPNIITNLDYPTRSVREPFLQGQVGYDKSLVQPGFDREAAKKTLDAAGWAVGSGGVRYKDGKPLTFVLNAANTTEYRAVAHELAQQWQTLGVKLQIQLQQPADFQSTLSTHSYDAVLYGISIGADPDVFVYWDSSQADIRASNRLNFSEYKNATADTSLETGRTRTDPALRIVKYKPFLQAWQQDYPALGLYQPRLLYLTNGTVGGLHDGIVNSPVNRYNNVTDWEVRQARVTN
jgi:peptide/nickel transport system substrate-binding protein